MESGALEQARYWMWERRKLVSTNPCGDSWEEQAFAADADGCTWPPRSYACNFCRREFRSAQALGGHMNVHRRDRALLKACSPPVEQSDPLPPVRNPNPNREVSAKSPRPLPSFRVKGNSMDGPSDLRLEIDGANPTKRKRDFCEVEGKDGLLLTTKKRQRFDTPVDAKVLQSPRDELDLELRLGKSPQVK